MPFLMTRGPVSATDLAAALRVNRSSIVRVLATFGEELETLGATRSTRYLLRRPVRSVGDRWPIFQIDETGNAARWATLESFHDRRWRVTWPDGESPPAWAAHYTDANGLWDGFPFFLADVRPQGFLGRAIGRRLGNFLGVPEDPRQWSDDHTLHYLHAAGEDMPGALVVGETALRAALDPRDSADIVAGEDRAARYPALAGAAMDSLPGSSAGGEQPKFTVRIRDQDAVPTAVLVKFSPPLDQTTGRRWADLLACEWLALQVLSEQGLAVAGARILDAGGRRFLEVPRFDRAGEHGRRSVVTLSALCPEADSHGIAVAWPRSMDALRHSGFVDEAAVRTVRCLHAFGEWIGNTDMHGGNLAFWLDATLPLRVAPAYDMLPMRWAPSSQGETIERAYEPPRAMPGREAEWRLAAEWSRDFWQRAARCDAISPEFRRLAQEAAEAIGEPRV